jgi:hypothetical protein
VDLLFRVKAREPNLEQNSATTRTLIILFYYNSTKQFFTILYYLFFILGHYQVNVLQIHMVIVDFDVTIIDICHYKTVISAMESPIRIAFISCLSRLDKTAFL